MKKVYTINVYRNVQINLENIFTNYTKVKNSN